MMISRRPNNRASTEYAPGPSRITACRIAIASIDDTTVWNKTGVGTSASQTAAHSAAMAVPAYGVNSPADTSEPLTTLTAPAAKPATVAPGSRRYSEP